MIHVKFISDPARTNISGDPTIAVTGTVMEDTMEESGRERVRVRKKSPGRKKRKREFLSKRRIEEEILLER